MKNTRILRLLITLPMIFAAAGSARAAESTPPTKPNIIFIFSDDHAIQTIGAYGSRLSQFCIEQQVTPNIDRLAAEGAVFVNSYCGNSLCSPSRATVLTGLHSHANGVIHLNQPLNPGLWTYPVGLREAGYQTAVFGKWHLATRPATDYWRILPGQGTYVNPSFEGPKGVEKHEGYTTDIITDMALDWLKHRKPDQPFFLAVQHKAPHREWTPPPRYTSWLDDVKVPEPQTLLDDFSNREMPSKKQKMMISDDFTMSRDVKVGPNYAKDPAYAKRNAEFDKLKPQGQELTRWKYQQLIKDYLRCVKGVDDSVGRIMQAVKDAGLEDNTIIIYSADQGFFNGEHGWFDKRWIYEESLHMPFIIKWPGVVKPGSRPTEFIQNIDYAPTFVDMAGGKIPEGLHGRSLVPVLRGEPPADWRKSVYYHYSDGGMGVARQYGIRTAQYTLVHFYDIDKWELFDDVKDPNQIRNVYANAEYAETVKKLKAELEELRTEYKDNSMNEPKGKKRAHAVPTEKQNGD